MKNKILWFIIFALLVIAIVVASIFINKKGTEVIQGESKQTNIINENNESKEEESMNVIKVNDSTFEQEVLNSNIPVLIDFYAEITRSCN